MLIFEFSVTFYISPNAKSPEECVSDKAVSDHDLQIIVDGAKPPKGAPFGGV